MRVLDWEGYEFISSTTSPAKVSVFLDAERTHSWKLQHWHNTKDIISSILNTENPAYILREESLYFVSKGMVRALIEPRSAVGSIGTLASAYAIAAMKYGKLCLPGSVTTIAFGDICSISFMDDLDNGLVSLGWPKHSVNLDYAHRIAQLLATPGSYNPDQGTWHVAIDGGETDEGLVHLENEVNEKSGVLSQALKLAEILLARATQDEWIELKFSELSNTNFRQLASGEFGPTLNPNWKLEVPLVESLVGSHTKSLNLDVFFTKCFSTFLDANLPMTALAVSSRGQTMVSRGLLLETVEAPRDAREALQLFVLPGQMKWRGARRTILHESSSGSNRFSFNSRLATYKLDQKKTDNQPLLDALRTLNDSGPTFAITQGLESDAIYLRSSRPGPSDEDTVLFTSLINWAFAFRVEPSPLTIEEQQRKCIDRGILKLLLKDAIHNPMSTHGWEQECRAIASYNGNDWDNILRFGTESAKHLNLIRQGEASIFDCVIAAQERFGKRWMIMANS